MREVYVEIGYTFSFCLCCVLRKAETQSLLVPDMPMLVHGHVSVQKTQASTCAQRTVMCEEKLIVTPRSEID